MKQWFIVDKETGTILPRSNHNTLEECIYWFVEPEILKTDQSYVNELWFEVSAREGVYAKELTIK